MDNPKPLFGDAFRARKEIDDLMRQLLGSTMPLLRTDECKWQPNVDVYESEESVIVVVELAGVTRDEVSVVFDDGKLYVSGIRKDVGPHKKRRYRQMEICYNEFGRVIHLPDNIDHDRISAKIHNGLMVVEAPMMNPKQPRNHQIEIG
jgi:HSP20 family protein